MAKKSLQAEQSNIVIKRSGNHEEKPHGGAWKIALADFMTSLSMVFFVLWVVGMMPEENRAGVSQYFQGIEGQKLNAMMRVDTGESLEDVGANPPSEPTEDTIMEVFKELNQAIDDSTAEVILSSDGTAIQIQFVSDLLFKSASASLSPRAKTDLANVGTILEKRGLFVHIYGFADNRRVRRGSKFKNNLNLSAHRAMSVMNNLSEAAHGDLSMTLHAEGELNPIAENGTVTGRKKNRRVEVYITMNSVPPRSRLNPNPLELREANLRKELQSGAQSL